MPFCRWGRGGPMPIFYAEDRSSTRVEWNRMRRVFLVISAVCLAASIMLAVMWVESYRFEDDWGIRYAGGDGAAKVERSVLVTSGDGELGIVLRRSVLINGDPAGWQVRHVRFGLPIHWILDSIGPSSVGIGAQSSNTNAQLSQMNEVDIPYWLAVLVLALPAPVYLAIWMRRKKPGHCAKCGYDLRASPERCPECGTATPGRLSSGSGNPGSREL